MKKYLCLFTNLQQYTGASSRKRRLTTLSSLRLPSGKKRIIEKRSRTLSSLQIFSTRVLFPTLIGPTIGSIAKSGVALGHIKKFRIRRRSVWRPNMQLSKNKYVP